MSISNARYEVDARLTHPPNASLQDIARFWGAYLNIALPINWFVALVMMMTATGSRSE